MSVDLTRWFRPCPRNRHRLRLRAEQLVIVKTLLILIRDETDDRVRKLRQQFQSAGGVDDMSGRWVDNLSKSLRTQIKYLDDLIRRVGGFSWLPADLENAVKAAGDSVNVCHMLDTILKREEKTNGKA